MIERLARLGYASIGIVYMIVGVFAVRAGMGQRGSAGGHKDAFAFILHQPFGRALLAVIAAGLAGYVLWRFVSAILDSEHRGGDVKGLGIRAASIFRGLIYSGMALEVMHMVAANSSRGSGGSEQKAEHWTGRLMQQPYGRWLVALAGLGVLSYGAYQLYAAWDAKLSKRISLGELDARVRGKVIAISRFGIAARGVVSSSSAARSSWPHSATTPPPRTVPRAHCASFRRRSSLWPASALWRMACTRS